MERAAAKDRPRAGAPSVLELQIEELVLHGFAPLARYRVADAAERELARLIAEGGLPRALLAGGDVAYLDGGRFIVAPGSEPAAIGLQVAQSLYAGLSKAAPEQPAAMETQV